MDCPSVDPQKSPSQKGWQTKSDGVVAPTRWRTYLRWRWAIFWTWVSRYSSDQVRYEIHQLGQDPHAYTQGETPSNVLKTIATLTKMAPGTRVLDVGCGQGSALAFWATHYEVVPLGIEIVPSLVSVSRSLWATLSLSGTLIQGDFSAVEWPESDVVFVAGTCFSDAALPLLVQKLRQVSPSVRIAVITLTLPTSHFELISEVPVRFLWGASRLRVYGVEKTLPTPTPPLPRRGARQLLLGIQTKKSVY